MTQLFKRLLVLSIALVLLGCSLPTPTPPATPICPQGDLSAPALSSPAMWAVVDSLTPTLSWATNDPSVPYPYGGCEPFGYLVHLRQGPYFETDIGAYSYGPFIRNWTPLTSLQPGQAYEWSVAAFVGSGNGPYADSRYFFTGPVCDTAALRDPRLLEPVNGAIVNTLQPLLVWEYKDPCIPEGYRIDLSTDPSFADTSLSGGTGNPSTRWLPGTDLTDCTWYYWRIAPINNTTLGPFSNTRSFMTDISGSCAYPLPILPTLIPVTVEPLFTIVPLYPIFTLDQNANCRIGPNVVFEARRSYLKGDALEVTGINDLRTWIYVKMPNEGENFCWVSLSTGTLNTDPDKVTVRESPPTPTPTTVPPTRAPKGTAQPTINCQNLTTYDACKAQFNYCQWVVNPTNNSGYCTARQP